MAALPTIQATTLEGAILELAFKLQALEAAATPPIDRVRVSIDADDKAADISIEMPVSFTSGTGGVTVAATTYV